VYIAEKHLTPLQVTTSHYNLVHCSALQSNRMHYWQEKLHQKYRLSSVGFRPACARSDSILTLVYMWAFLTLNLFVQKISNLVYISGSGQFCKSDPVKN
jgi:hypothetical protein